MKKILVRVSFNALLGVVLFWVWLQFVNVGELVKKLSTTDVKLLLWFFIFFLLSTFLRSVRLKWLLYQYHLPLLRVVALTFLSQLLSFAVPIRAGEIGKGVYLSTQHFLPFDKTLVWILVDRFLDFWVVLFLAGVFLTFVPNNLGIFLQQLTFFVSLGSALMIILAILKQQVIRDLLRILSNFLIHPKLKKTFLYLTTTALEGLTILERHPLQLLILLGLTVVTIFSDAMIWYMVLSSLGLKMEVLTVWLGSLLSMLTFLLPAAPGYVGSAHSFGLAVFSGVMGIEANLASAAVVLNHLLTAVVLLISGIISLHFLQFDISLVWKKLKREG